MMNLHNEAFGWVWIVLGVLSGAILGMGFLRNEFLGGYASPRRRLIRLGHISFIGLGALNILFAHTMIRFEPNQMIEIASISFIIAGVAMPLCCGIVAWRQSLHFVFAVPVAAALLATALTAWEVLQ